MGCVNTNAPLTKDVVEQLIAHGKEKMERDRIPMDIGLKDLCAYRTRVYYSFIMSVRSNTDSQHHQDTVSLPDECLLARNMISAFVSIFKVQQLLQKRGEICDHQLFKEVRDTVCGGNTCCLANIDEQIRKQRLPRLETIEASIAAGKVPNIIRAKLLKLRRDILTYQRTAQEVDPNIDMQVSVLGIINKLKEEIAKPASFQSMQAPSLVQDTPFPTPPAFMPAPPGGLPQPRAA